MKQHRFQQGEDIEAIARQYGFRLPATIWEDRSNNSLRELRKSAYALAPGDVLIIPDLQVKNEDASDEKRHVFQLRGLIRPAFYSRLVPDTDLPAARFGPVFAQPGAVGFDVSFAPHLSGALAHAAAAHDSARFHALVATRGRLTDAALAQSIAYLFLGKKDDWVSDALARHEEADLRTLLTWVANVLGFPCDPGNPGADLAQGVVQGLRRLRAACNIRERSLRFKADLEPRPAEDWPALFDAIDERLRAAAGLSKEQVAAARSKIQLLSPAWVDLTRSDGIEGTAPGASLDLVLFDEQVVRATPGSVHPLLSKLSSFVYASLESKQTATPFEPLRPDVLEFEDVHFGPGRSVLLPTELTAAGPDEDWGITGADVLLAALRHANDHPNRTILVTGHTDSTSTQSANFKLSKKRAENVRMMLIGMGIIDAWTELAAKDGTPEDAWEYLRWISDCFGYGCMPSPADAPNKVKDAQALIAFRRRYNEDVKDLGPIGNPYQPAFTKQLNNLRGPLSRDDWRAFFEMMQRHFTRQLRIDMGQLIELQTRLNFGDEGLGCGESHPFNEEERERRRLAMYEDENIGERPGDRRVEIIFLDPDEAVLLGNPLLCHPTPDAGACKPELCILYDQKLFEFRRLSATPQQGKIEIIERTVWRNPRLFTNDTDEFREEVSGDLTPILGEKVQILVRVTPPYTPFEGFLELRIGRRTSDDEKPVTTVARIYWRAPETNSNIVTLDGPRYFIIEWDGYATEYVPREYSDRRAQSFDEIQKKMVNIPMMEMEPGQRAKHGPYVIEMVQLLEKDRTVAAQYAPEQERNELVMVVQPTIEVAMFREHDLKNLLHEVGFGEPVNPDPKVNDPLRVPLLFVEALERAILRRIARFLKGCNLRFIGTNGVPTTAGLALWIECDPLGQPGSETVNFREVNGVTGRTVVLNGVQIFQNLFLCHDQHESPVGASTKADSLVFARNLLFSTRSDEGRAPREAALKAFGRVGFPPDRRIVHRIVKNPEAVATQGDAYSFEGAPNSPRTVDGDEVVGLVNDLDAAGSAVRVDPSNGVVTVSPTNPALVPPRRASDISLALNACAAWISYIAAHELGHMLGASVTRINKLESALLEVPMPDGSSVGPYMHQDEDGEDPEPAAAQLMSPSSHSFAQRLGLVGPAITFLSQQAEYLRAVAPFAADFVERKKP